MDLSEPFYKRVPTPPKTSINFYYKKHGKRIIGLKQLFQQKTISP
jgi:hypothetical protein